MGTSWQRRILAGLFLAATLCTGCNIMALPFFLLPGMEPKHDAKCKLAPKEKGKDVKVLLLTTTGLETRPEFLRVDRELSRKLCQVLGDGFKKNKEKIQVVPTSKLDRYKDEHPNWHGQAPAEIGEHFGADYVVSLEINSLSLYEQGSVNTLFRGHADISIDVVDVHKPAEGPIYKEEYRCEYPRTKGPIPASDSNVAQFRELFLSRVARELSWRFTSHEVDEELHMDD
jgi:hypothetical protein